MLLVVRAEGLEPPRLSSREPKSRASTNSATPATGGRPGGAAYIMRNPSDHKKNSSQGEVGNRPLRRKMRSRWDHVSSAW